MHCYIIFRFNWARFVSNISILWQHVVIFMIKDVTFKHVFLICVLLNVLYHFLGHFFHQQSQGLHWCYIQTKMSSHVHQQFLFFSATVFPPLTFIFLSFSIGYHLNCNILLVGLKTCWCRIDRLILSFLFSIFSPVPLSCHLRQWYQTIVYLLKQTHHTVSNMYLSICPSDSSLNTWSLYIIFHPMVNEIKSYIILCRVTINWLQMVKNIQ